MKDRGSDKDSLNSTNQDIMKPMRELMQTERDYVNDLKRCVDIYLNEYQCSGSMCPQVLRNKECEIFGNLKALYEFHSK